MCPAVHHIDLRLTFRLKYAKGRPVHRKKGSSMCTRWLEGVRVLLVLGDLNCEPSPLVGISPSLYSRILVVPTCGRSLGLTFEVSPVEVEEAALPWPFDRLRIDGQVGLQKKDKFSSRVIEVCITASSNITTPLLCIPCVCHAVLHTSLQRMQAVIFSRAASILPYTKVGATSNWACNYSNNVVSRKFLPKFSYYTVCTSASLDG